MLGTGTTDLIAASMVMRTLVPLGMTPVSALARGIAPGDQTILVVDASDFSTDHHVEVYDGIHDYIMPLSEDWDGSPELLFNWSGFATPGFQAAHAQGAAVGTNLYDRGRQSAALELDTGFPAIFVAATNTQTFYKAQPLYVEPTISLTLDYFRSLVQKRPVGGATKLMDAATWAFEQEWQARRDMQRIHDALLDNWFLEDEGGYQHSLGYGDLLNASASLITVQWGEEVIDKDNTQFSASATISLRGRGDQSEAA